MKIEIDPQLHEKKIEELASQIRRCAEESGRRPEHVGRARFLAWRGPGEGARFVKTYWAPAKERATGGAVPAPPIDPIPAGHAVKGVSTYVDADGVVKGQWVKTRLVGESPEDAIARWRDALPEIVTPRVGSIDPPAETNDDLLAVYPLGDPHVGLLAWGRESGANFDLEIAERLMVGAMRDLVLRGPRARGALIVNLGDYFHFDNADHHTTSGEHALDVDGRTAKVLDAGIRIFVALIDAALEHHEIVSVDNVAGNHDRYTSIMLSIALRHYYRHEARVYIPTDPATRHYWTHGEVLLGTTHGDRGRLEDLAGVMAAERPREWGASTHRHWICGHVHHAQTKELRGATVETFRTLAARDAWHAAQGYHAQRDLSRIVYHRRWGEIERARVSAEYLEREAGARS